MIGDFGILQKIQNMDKLYQAYTQSELSDL